MKEEVDQLKRLCEVDPEHFRKRSDFKYTYGWRYETGASWYAIVPQQVTWEIAGWMLDQLREQYNAPADGVSFDENVALIEAEAGLRLAHLTPALITEHYIAWKESAAAPDRKEAPVEPQG